METKTINSSKLLSFHYFILKKIHWNLSTIHMKIYQGKLSCKKGSNWLIFSILWAIEALNTNQGVKVRFSKHLSMQTSCNHRKHSLQQTITNESFLQSNKLSAGNFAQHFWTNPNQTWLTFLRNAIHGSISCKQQRRNQLLQPRVQLVVDSFSNSDFEPNTQLCSKIFQPKIIIWN